MSAVARRHSVDGDRANAQMTRRQSLQTSKKAQSSGLARPRRSHQDHELSVGNIKREVGDGGDRTKALRRLIECYRRHQSLLAPDSIPRMKWRWEKK